MSDKKSGVMSSLGAWWPMSVWGWLRSKRKVNHGRPNRVEVCRFGHHLFKHECIHDIFQLGETEPVLDPKSTVKSPSST